MNIPIKYINSSFVNGPKRSQIEPLMIELQKFMKYPYEGVDTETRLKNDIEAFYKKNPTVPKIRVDLDATIDFAVITIS